VIIAIPFVMALFIKNELNLQSEIIINKPAPEVFNYVKLLRNQDYYSKWVMMDPAMKKSYKGTDGTAGFIYAWEGNSDVGKGEQEIKNIQENQKIDVEVRFEEPMKVIASTPIITEAVSENQTKVKWGMSSRTPYPFNFMNLFTESMLRKDVDTSLATLKRILEK
jgi:hypothetical protein